MKFLFSLLFLFLALEAVTLSGTIYDSDTDEIAKNILMKLSGPNTYQFFSRDGVFSLEVVAGNYSVNLVDVVNGSVVRESKEDVSIDSDSVIDFLIFPVDNYDIDDSTIFQVNDTSENPVVVDQPVETSYSAYLILMLFLLILFSFFLVYYLNSREKKLVVNDVILTAEEELIYNLIKKEKIFSQKELRKNVSLSEAKVSMILSSLEEKGILKKVRKGNANELEVMK